MLQRSEVIEEVGSEAFDYGLLIGHEDFRLIRGESEDILVTFPHRSIQEFLGSLYFVLMLIEGVSYKTLLGKHSQRPIFMMNPLFLQFCMWLLHSDKGHFSLQKYRGSFRPARFVCGAKNCFRGVNHPEYSESLPCSEYLRRDRYISEPILGVSHKKMQHDKNLNVCLQNYAE